MSNIVDSQGTMLKRGDGVEPTEGFEPVTGLTSIGPIQVAAGRPLRQKTTLADKDTHKHKFSLADMAEIECPGFFDPDDAQHAGLIADHNAGTVRNFQIIIPTDPETTYQLSALVMVDIPTIAVDVDIPMNLTLKPQSRLTEV